MNDDQKELVEYLDGKFTKIDEKFEKTVTKQDLLDLSVKLLPREEFTQFKTETNQNFSDLKESLNILTNAEDKVVGTADKSSQEDTMLNHKVNRLEGWLKKMAEKMDMKLEY